MAIARSGRLEDRKAKKRLALATVGMLGLLAFFGIFGLKLLVGFSLFVDRIRGGGPTPAPVQTLILPPTLEPIDESTKSATLVIRGAGQEGLMAIVYLDDEESKKATIGRDGTFSVTIAGLSEAIHTVSAKQSDDRGNTSELSNVLTVTIKKTPPILELTSPEDNAIIRGDDNRVTVSGKTEEDATITVNSRIVVVRSDLTFSYPFPLNPGDNKLTIVATDPAGNTTTIERNIKYER